MCKSHQRILIVDDDRDTLANLSDILTDVGYETDTGACGAEAMRLLNSVGQDQGGRCYDLCLLDFKMPGMDGVELYNKISVRQPDLRAIMITAYAGDDGLVRAKQAGTWRVLKKPVDIKILLQTIREAIA